MKTKGKSAWLITWDGSESKYNGRCKVVAVLPPQLGEKSIISLLSALYCSEHNFTLCEKMSFCIPKGKDRFLKQPYRDINPEFFYGEPPKIFLRARKIKDLRCEESKRDCFENTLHWTELPKFIPNPDFDPNGPTPENLDDLIKPVRGEMEVEYTYSIRPNIKDEKKRQAKQVSDKLNVPLAQ
jgi:hypothetical protein